MLFRRHFNRKLSFLFLTISSFLKRHYLTGLLQVIQSTMWLGFFFFFFFVFFSLFSSFFLSLLYLILSSSSCQFFRFLASTESLNLLILHFFFFFFLFTFDFFFSGFTFFALLQPSSTFAKLNNEVEDAKEGQIFILINVIQIIG